MRRSRLLAAAALAAALALAPAAASATPPENAPPNCFGKGASQMAQGEFADAGIPNMGAHASGQENPRLGIGNTARAFGMVHQSDLALALGASC